MEADAALVRADGVVKLYAVAQVILYLAAVVEPGHAESDDTVGLDHTLDDLVAFKLGVTVVDVLNRHEHLMHGLQVFLLTRMLGLQVGHDFFDIHNINKGC